MIRIPHLLEWVKAVVASCFQFMMMMRSLYFRCGDSVEPRDVVGRIVGSVRVNVVDQLARGGSPSQ